MFDHWSWRVVGRRRCGRRVLGFLHYVALNTVHLWALPLITLAICLPLFDMVEAASLSTAAQSWSNSLLVRAEVARSGVRECLALHVPRMLGTIPADPSLPSRSHR